MSSSEYSVKEGEQKEALKKLQDLQAREKAAYQEWQRQLELIKPQGPQRIAMTTPQKVEAAESAYNALVAASDEARKQIPQPPWMTEFEPVLPVAVQPTAVASAQPTNSQSTEVASPGESAIPVTPQPTASDSTDSSAAPAPSSVPETPRPSIERYALAFAIDRNRLLTAADVVADAKRVRMEDAQGNVLSAHVLAKDQKLALLELDGGGAAGALRYLNIAESFTGGPVKCAAIPTANVFAPQTMLLSGEAPAPPQEGQWAVRLSDHPRLPGSPLLASDGSVVGVVVPTRDDLKTHLPAIGLKQIREFLTSNSALPSARSPNPDPTSVYQVTIEEQ